MRRFLFSIFCLFFFLVSRGYPLGIESFSGFEINTVEEGSQYFAFGFWEPLRNKTTSIAFRIFSSYLTYKYETNQGKEIIATSFILTPLFGVKNKSLALWLGPTLRKSKGEQNIETQKGIFIQTELEKRIKKINLGLILSYSSEYQYFWGRGRMKKEITTGGHNSYWVGLDLIGQGNPNFSASQVNGIFEFCKHSFSLLFKGGYWIKGYKKSIYIGVEFYNSLSL